jgi:hypothetical protein
MTFAESRGGRPAQDGKRILRSIRSAGLR